MGKVIVSYTKDIFIDLEQVEFLDINTMKPFNKDGLTDKDILKKYEDGEIIIKSLRQVEKHCDDYEILSINIMLNED